MPEEPPVDELWELELDLEVVTKLLPDEELIEPKTGAEVVCEELVEESELDDEKDVELTPCIASDAVSEVVCADVVCVGEFAATETAETADDKTELTSVATDSASETIMLNRLT